MKRTLLAAVLLASAGSAFAQYGALTGSVNLDYSTMDVWRGLNLVDDSVLKGTVHVKMDALSAFIQGRMELTDTNSYPLTSDPTGHITAVRGGVFYTYNYDKRFDVTLGAMVHQYPGVGQAQTEELYYGFDFGGLGDFSIEVMQDVEQVKGYYVRASVHHTFSEGVPKNNGSMQPITLSAHVAYADNKYNLYYYGANTSTLADLGIRASTDFTLGGFTVTPYLAYTSFLDPDLVAGGPHRTNFYGGVSVGMKF